MKNSPTRIAAAAHVARRARPQVADTQEATALCRMKCQFPPAAQEARAAPAQRPADRRRNARPPSPRRTATPKFHAWKAGLAGALGSAALMGCSTTSQAPALQVGPLAFEPVLRTQSGRYSAAQAYELGKRALAEGRAGLALGWFDYAITVDPAAVDATNGKVVALARLGRPAQALTVAEQSLAQGRVSEELTHNVERLRARIPTLAPQADVADASAAAQPAPLGRAAAAAAVVEIRTGHLNPPEPPPAATVESRASVSLRWTATGEHVLELSRSGAGPAGEPVTTASAAAAPGTAPEPVPQHAAGASASMRPDARFEVSNGAGAEGLARSQSRELAAAGLDVRHVTNHKHFQVRQTEVRFRDEPFRTTAEAAAALLRVNAELLLDGQLRRGVDVRIVLGRDAADAVLARGQDGGVAGSVAVAYQRAVASAESESITGNRKRR